MNKEEKDQEKDDYRLGIGISLGLVVIIGILLFFYLGRGGKNQAATNSSIEPSGQSKEAKNTGETAGINIPDLVERLNRAGAAMYGSDACGHCQHQKEVFGDYFKKINYYSYQDNPDIFKEKGIEYFPTWIINGKKHIGFQTLEELSKLVD